METIFALSTAPVKSGIAVMRISGESAKKCAAILTGKSEFVARMATLCKIKNPKISEIIDEALLLWFPRPHSFTGEDTIELHLHGSRAIIEEVSEILSKIDGVRLAEPGEFSKRAFDNNKMDLTEAEGLADLIDAQTKAQARQAMRQKTGILRELYDKWRVEFISIMANIEAYIDFPDEDIPESVVVNLTSQVNALTNSIESHLDDKGRGEKLRSGLYAVIAGCPNVGKSSLLNCIAKRDVAIVSEVAGTTRDIIEVSMDIGGYPLTIADTAGIRQSDNAIEKEGIKRAVKKLDDADIKIIMLSAENLLEEYAASKDLLKGESVVVLINKADLVEEVLLPESLSDLKPIIISVADSSGVEEFLEKLHLIVEEQIGFTEEPVITRQRYRALLQEVLVTLDAFNLDEDIEIASENLRRASVSLGKITGHIDVEDILDNIFSTFCIGK